MDEVTKYKNVFELRKTMKRETVVDSTSRRKVGVPLKIRKRRRMGRPFQCRSPSSVASLNESLVNIYLFRGRRKQCARRQITVSERKGDVTSRFEITLSLRGSYYDQGKLHGARAGDLFTERRGPNSRVTDIGNLSGSR